MQKKTIILGGTTCILELDEDGAPGYGHSSITFIYPEGHGDITPVPSIIDPGVPGFGGREPTMEDLRDLAMLQANFMPVMFRIGRQGDKALPEVARAIGMELPKNDGTFEWLLIIREAVELGVVPLEEEAPSPGSRH